MMSATSQQESAGAARRYFKDAGILGLTEMALRLNALVIIPVLTKHFGTQSYGIWAQVFVLSGLLAPALAWGLDSAAVRFLSGAPEDEIRHGIGTCLAFGCGACLVVGLAVSWLAPLVAQELLGGANNAAFLPFAIGFTATSLVSAFLLTFLRIFGWIRLLAVIRIVNALLDTVVPVLAVILGLGLLTLVELSLAADATVVLALVAIVHLRFGIGRPKLPLLREMLRYGTVLVPAGYGMVIMNLSDRLFLAHFRTMAEVGIYSLAYSLGYLGTTFFFNPLWAMYPVRATELYRAGDQGALQRLFVLSTKVAAGLMIPTIVGLTALGQPVLQALATVEFAAGARLAGLIALAYTFSMFSSYFSVSLGLLGRQHWLAVSMAGGTIVDLALNALLIPRFGMAGAAWATLAAFSVQLALEAWQGSRAIRLVPDWAFMIRSVLAAACMGAVLWLLPTSARATLYLSIPIGALSYVGALIALRGLEANDLRAALQVIGLDSGRAARFVRALGR
ncbi:MAG TPA: oligosaccharide flippase family protein [Chloroflexota bacterium]|nr:oligosaccharide flippase family protein [Chloroflexota bacterium]